MVNIARKTSLLGLIVFISLIFNQETKAQSEESSLQDITVVSVDEIELIADKAKMRNEMLVIDSVLLQMGLDAEEEMFPANNLYSGAWSNKSVKAYSNLAVPESYTIDVSEFVMPFEGRVTSRYGMRKRRFHYGIDIKLQTGDTIRAAFDGKVRVRDYERRGYGNYLVLRHPNGLETVYGHLSKFLTEENETVKAGQPIALGGNTGRSTGSHLHLEFRFLGIAINPEEIVDFDQSCTRDEVYVYRGGKIEGVDYASVSGQKYLNQSKSTETKKSSQNTGKLKYYRIKQGDTLGAIARRNGTTVNKLCKLNNIKPTTTLRVGASLRLS